MSKYIDTDELIFIGLDNPDCEHLFEFVPKEFIDNMPPADVRENKYGEWHILDECSNEGVYCSICHKKVFKYDFSNTMKWNNFNFCPNCGADMRKGETNG